MNCKKLLGLLVLGLGLAVTSPRHAFADTYTLAISSWTVNTVSVSTFAWTQVDSPQLAGRTSIEIYNVDTSSPMYCRQDNAPFITIAVSSNVPSNVRTIPKSGGNVPNWWSLSLSSFASNRGAYPVSTSMPVYCLAAKDGAAGTAQVTQSY